MTCPSYASADYHAGYRSGYDAGYADADKGTTFTVIVELGTPSEFIKAYRGSRDAVTRQAEFYLENGWRGHTVRNVYVAQEVSR